MKLKGILTCVFWITSSFLYGQSDSKEITYNKNDYNIYKIKITPSALESFAIFHNNDGLSHEQAEEDIKSIFDSVNVENSFFLTNAGIVESNCAPIGLFTDDYKTYNTTNSSSGNGNFYLEPNGALLIMDNTALVCKTSDIPKYSGFRIGIQTGPMLVHDGIINSKFNAQSQNKFIRSGVGIYTDVNNYDYLVFAISTTEVSFYEFSDFFLNVFNCPNALCIESSRSVMTIPDLNNNVNSQEVVCRYLYHKASHGVSSGTGFSISSDGLIATNYHVIEDAKSIVIKGVNGDFTKSFTAKVEVEDMQHDLAILRITDPSFTGAKTPPYTISPNIIDVGSSAFALGYPLRSTMGDEIKLTDGKISANSGFNGDKSTYQISVPIQPGNSGGPLFGKDGDVIGITNAGHTGAQNANYAIKTNFLFSLIGMMPKTPVLPTKNTISLLTLPEQVKVIKNHVFIVETTY